MNIINHECYVSLEVAKLLKEAGFNFECRKIYYKYPGDTTSWSLEDNYMNLPHLLEVNFALLAPTLEVAQRWLLEVKNCCVSVVADCDASGVHYTTRIIYHDKNDNYYATHVWEETEIKRAKHRQIFNNYEEAKEVGIKKALETILEEGE